MLSTGYLGLALGAPALDLDITLLIQTAIFLIMLLFLNHVLFQPYLKARAKRLAKTRGAKDKSKKILEETAMSQQEYDARHQATVQEAESKRRTEIAKANAEASEILSQAREASQKRIQESRAGIAKDIAAAREGLDDKIDVLADNITNKLLA